VREELFFSQNSTAEHPSYLANVTGYEYFATALETRTHKKRYYFTRFLNQTSTRKLIHVGEQPFNNVSSNVATSFLNDLEFSSKAQMEQLLNLKYRVLIYVGQMDLITPHVGVANFIRSMDFEGKSEFEKSERRIMRDLKRGDVSGYVKAHANLFYVVVRNAGHHAPSDEPRWCREMVEKFISGTSDEDF
jgi:vitellogenic carboxypeptidase-like protein